MIRHGLKNVHVIARPGFAALTIIFTHSAETNDKVSFGER